MDGGLSVVMSCHFYCTNSYVSQLPSEFEVIHAKVLIHFEQHGYHYQQYEHGGRAAAAAAGASQSGAQLRGSRERDRQRLVGLGRKTNECYGPQLSGETGMFESAAFEHCVMDKLSLTSFPSGTYFVQHYMLSELEDDNQDHIVSWAPHGRCFVVHDQVSLKEWPKRRRGLKLFCTSHTLTLDHPSQDEFVRSILPMWFRQTKFASFQRQVCSSQLLLTTCRIKKELFLTFTTFFTLFRPAEPLRLQASHHRPR